jgi:surfactin synthase thioesterase subunit
MGALLAFKTSTQLLMPPSKLILSGMSSPSLAQQERFHELSFMSLDKLAVYLDSLGGISFELNRSSALMQKFLKITQNDFKLLAQISDLKDYKFKNSTTLITGEDDMICTLTGLMGWAKYLTGSTRYKVFPGNHFYLFQATSLIHTYLIEEFSK